MIRNVLYSLVLSAFVCSGLSCCSGNNDFTATDGSCGPLVIYPDYKDVTVPVNIAPLNFHYAMRGAERASTVFSYGDKSVRIKGLTVEWTTRRWKRFIENAAGQTISVSAELTVDGRRLSDIWHISVSSDSLDPYLTYRLIEPAYQMFNEVSIVERCIENFDETVICDYSKTDNSCMNCHIHGQQRGDLSMYYIRGPHGGAILNRGGKLRKLNLNADGMLSGTVYGDIHPTGRFGVFSTNIIVPGFHSVAANRMEVYDTASDLIVADFDNNRMISSKHVERPDRLETFPCFSADGQSVFYCVADTLTLPKDICNLKYSIVRAGFDAGSGHMGSRIDTVWNGQANNASACHPKASPDGRWLMFTVSDYGTFPLYHTESTLCLLNLESGQIMPLECIKGDKSDTYHSWSSDGRWFVFASKRGDGQYGKPYFCHIDEDGNVTKPFVLPQKSSRFYVYNLKSFNIPDLGRESTGMTLNDARRMFKEECETFMLAD